MEFPPTRSLRRRDERGGAFPARPQPPRQTALAAWRRGGVRVLAGTAIIAATLIAGGIHHLYFDRTNLPDLDAFSRFELPVIGHVYDVDGRPLIEMASEYRQITSYEDIPPILRDAILAAGPYGL